MGDQVFKRPSSDLESTVKMKVDLTLQQIHVKSDQEREFLRPTTPDSENKPRRLDGAVSKQLSCLPKSGILINPHYTKFLSNEC